MRLSDIFESFPFAPGSSTPYGVMDFRAPSYRTKGKRNRETYCILTKEHKAILCYRDAPSDANTIGYNLLSDLLTYQRDYILMKRGEQIVFLPGGKLVLDSKDASPENIRPKLEVLLALNLVTPGTKVVIGDWNRGAPLTPIDSGTVASLRQ
jgi:hypothetical protein